MYKTRRDGKGSTIKHLRYSKAIKSLLFDRIIEMDLFGGWPFYHGPQRSWNDPRCSGNYDRRSRASMEPSYDDYYPGSMFTPDWYPEMYSSPFHRANRRPSPFDLRRPSPFESMFTGNSQRKPAKAEQRHSPPDVNASMSAKGNIEDPVNMESQDAGKKGQSNSDHLESTQTVSSTPASTETVNRSTPSPAEEAQLKATTDEVKKPSPEIQRITEIVEKTVALENSISSFEGGRGSKPYIFIEESLVSLLLLLDKIETNGDMDIRKARKSAVCQIQQLLSDLENKTKAENTATAQLNSDQAEESPEEVAEDVLTPEDMLNDGEVMKPAVDTVSEVEDNNMQIEPEILTSSNNTHTEPENKSDNTATEVSVTDTETSITETPTTESPVTDMDTSDTDNTVTEVVEDLPQSDEVSESPTEDISDTSMDTVTAPIVLSPSDDEEVSSSEETVTE